MDMKKIIVCLSLLLLVSILKAQEKEDPKIVLMPYIQTDNNTPQVDEILHSKLERIVTQYGISSSNGESSSFIITAHPVVLNKETTATVPPATAIEILLTLYIGNAEDGTIFSSYGVNLKGVGSSLEKAYVSAFNRININDEGIKNAIQEGKKRIIQYYLENGSTLLKKAESSASLGDYDQAYRILLQVPSICPQYDEAQSLLLTLVGRQYENENMTVLSKAKGEWSSDPTEVGAQKATETLQKIECASPAIISEVNKLMAEMSKVIQKNTADKLALQKAAAENEHEEKLAAIAGAAKVAAAYVSRPVYHIHWW